MIAILTRHWRVWKLTRWTEIFLGLATAILCIPRRLTHDAVWLVSLRKSGGQTWKLHYFLLGICQWMILDVLIFKSKTIPTLVGRNQPSLNFSKSALLLKKPFKIQFRIVAHTHIIYWSKFFNLHQCIERRTLKCPFFTLSNPSMHLHTYKIFKILYGGFFMKIKPRREK